MRINIRRLQSTTLPSIKSRFPPPRKHRRHASKSQRCMGSRMQRSNEVLQCQPWPALPKQLRRARCQLACWIRSRLVAALSSCTSSALARKLSTAIGIFLNLCARRSHESHPPSKTAGILELCFAFLSCGQNARTRQGRKTNSQLGASVWFEQLDRNRKYVRSFCAARYRHTAASSYRPCRASPCSDP